MTELVRERLKTVPNRPGCYLMRDRRGVIIYVGKAKNLKRRVSSYFRPGAKHPPKVRSMVDTVYDFEFMTVKNEAESLLTEASLIKKHKPHFNILMRDDKRYLALRADPAEGWPRFSCCRIVRDDGARYFGPFPSAPIVRTAKDFCEKRWGIRECQCLVPDEEAHRHCLANVIRRCSAPCLGQISQADYRAKFDEACAFLEGKNPAVLAEVDAEMRAAAEKGDFEKAARLRDTLFALKEMTKQHFIRKTPERTRDEALEGIQGLADAIGLSAPPRIIECVDISNLFGTHNVASLVVAREGLPDRRYYRHFRIKSFTGADDPRAMAEVMTRRFERDSTVAEHLPIPDLVICDGGITQLRAARAAMADLIANHNALEGAENVPFVGLAERNEELVLDPETIPGNLERTGDKGQRTEGKGHGTKENQQPTTILLPRDSQALFVITRLRDEAHRFAIAYHRNLRERTIRESVLDEVPGIGEAKKVKLLKAFKSVYGIARADEAEIASVAGVNAQVAAAVRRAAASLSPRTRNSGEV